MSDIKSFKESWKKISDLAAGGQGTTIKASSIADDKILAAVKILNKQNDDERRARMYRETVALTTLDHKNIPKIIDTNTEFWKDKEYKLFLATEFIEGSTLFKIDFSKLFLKEIIQLTLRISEVVKYCHEREIIHRDIKPDNVILRNNSIDDPVIIDFGISFNFNDEDETNLTADEQHIGNRFLILPEQKIGEVAKRDYRTDVTCVVGLFYYFLTRKIPTILMDEQNKSPHQRGLSKEIIDGLPRHEKDIVNNIFDIGFNPSIDKRWQSIQKLIDQLHILDKAEPIKFETDDHLKQYIKLRSDNVSLEESKFLKSLLAQVDRTCIEATIETVEELGGEWMFQQSGNMSTAFDYSNLFNISTRKKELTSTLIIASIAGDEMVVKVVETEDKTELFRQPVKQDIARNELKSSLKSHYLRVIASKM